MADSEQVQFFSVPAGVTALTVEVDGAAGGSEDGGDLAGGAGSGEVVRVSVVAGEVLSIYVGEAGTGQGGWGFGCGGDGGTSTLGNNAAGGGGASAVVVGVASPGAGQCPTGRGGGVPSDVLVVAGGGGGAGGSLGADFSPLTGGYGGAAGLTPAGGGFGEYTFVTQTPQGPMEENVPFPGGCGGCENGADGSAGQGGLATGSGSGGGGGGVNGGGGGATFTGSSGAGGGGGLSYVTANNLSSTSVPGVGTGDGSVTVTTLPVDVFGCTQGLQAVTVPPGAGVAAVHAVGGYGGANGGNSGQGGPGGFARGDLTVTPGESLDVWVGCYGGPGHGWGWSSGGSRGSADSDSHNGAGGGGSSAVGVDNTPLLVAGGGGGGGGNAGSPSDPGTGGHGGGGGVPGISGSGGNHGVDDGGGGCGSCLNTPTGQSGDDGPGYGGGAGGAGGGGWFGGGGGGHGVGFAGGGGGGGGGLSYATMTGGVVAASVGSDSSQSPGSDGYVLIEFLPPGPARLSAVSGAGQTAVAGAAFPSPLRVWATDADGNPVVDAPVQFDIPTGQLQGGNFPGNASQAVVHTDEDGVAESPVVTAGAGPGLFTVTATTTSSVPPATFQLTTAPLPTVVTVTPGAYSASGNPTQVDVGVLQDGNPVSNGTFTVTLDGDQIWGILPQYGQLPVPLPEPLSPGTHTITASYTPPSFPAPGWNFGASSTTTTVQISKGLTVTTAAVVSRTGSPEPGSPVTYTATMNGPSDAVPYSGPVTFTVNNSTALQATATNGTATLEATAPSTPGTYQLTVAAAATATRQAATGSTTFQVNDSSTGLSITADPVIVTYQQSAPIDLFATLTDLTSSSLNGTVVFTDSRGHNLCSVYVSSRTGPGICPASIGSLAPGVQQISATLAGSVDSLTASTTIDVVSPASSVSLRTTTTGSETAVRATVTAPNGAAATAGAVQFFRGGTPLGSPARIQHGHATLTGILLPPGPWAITALYSGSTHSRPAAAVRSGIQPYSPTVVHIHTTNPAAAPPDPSRSPALGGAHPTPTRPDPITGRPLTVVAPPTPLASAGQYTAAITDAQGRPRNDGAVQFYVENVPAGPPVIVHNGTATLPSKVKLPPGRHVVTAAYHSGISARLSSTAHTIQHIAAPTTLVIALGPQPGAAPVTATARVAAGATAGTISYLLDNDPVATCQHQKLHDSQTTCNLDHPTPGHHTLTAQYSGTPNNTPATLTTALLIAAPTPRTPPLANTGAPGDLTRSLEVSAGLLIAGTLSLLTTRRRATTRTGRRKPNS